MATRRMIDNRPAAETAAAVSDPEIAEAMLRPARTRHMTSIKTTPIGVLIALIMVPLNPLLPPLPKVFMPPSERKAGKIPIWEKTQVVM